MKRLRSVLWPRRHCSSINLIWVVEPNEVRLLVSYTFARALAEKLDAGADQGLQLVPSELSEVVACAAKVRRICCYPRNGRSAAIKLPLA